MPITPFHLGPGAIFKAALGRHFSFMVFGGSQVLIDLEPLVGIIRNSPILHGYSHTALGALLIGTFAGVVGKPISKFVLDILKVHYFPFTWRASFVAAYLGTFSHILFDAVMHGDMRPWWPISNFNGLLSYMPIGQLHILCVVFGLIGGAVIAIKFHKHGKA